MFKTGLFVGRFQPFHNGHYNAIHEALLRVDELIIGIGSAQKHGELPNPFTFDERMRMICSSIEDKDDRIYVTSIPDFNNYIKWIDYVVSEFEFDVILTGSKLVKTLADNKKIPVIWITRPDDISATIVRQKLIDCEPIEDLVPSGTLMVLGEIGAYERMKEINENQLPMIEVEE